MNESQPPTTANSRALAEIVLTRRNALGAFGVAALLAACGSTGSKSVSTTGLAPPDSAAAADVGAASEASTTCTEVPAETAGPFPGDGSNGPNVLTEDDVVRSDIRTSIGSASGVAEGVPLTVTMTIVDTNNGCAPLAGAGVYIWHCDMGGSYSMYSDAADTENYLRGVQETDTNGQVTFLTVFPGAYSGRWPHIHFEVYDTLSAATSAGNPIATSQIALPEQICAEVYATAGYEASVRNLAQTSLTSDMVFGDDGGVDQLPDITGTVSADLTATLVLGV